MNLNFLSNKNAVFKENKTNETKKDVKKSEQATVLSFK
jgi:hypothetical protein